MTIDEISWMLELFRSGKVSAAAEKLYISQSAMSQCLQRIETQLGFRLFERNNRGLIPTEKGILFRSAAEKIMESYNEFLTGAALLDQKELKDISIGMAPYLSSRCSVELINTLRKKYPDIRFSVYDAFTPDLLNALRDNRIQLLVTNEIAGPEDFEKYEFGKMSTVIFLRRGSPAEGKVFIKNGKRYLDPKYLAEEPLALTRQGQASRNLSDELLKEAGISPPVVHETRHISSLYKYAQEGIASAIAQLTAEAAEMDENEHLICRVTGNYKRAHTRWNIKYSPGIGRMIPDGLFQTIQNIVLQSLTTIL